MKIENAVKRHNDKEHSDEITQALREFSQGYPVWREGQPLDLERARKVLAHCKSGGTAPQGYVTTDVLIGAAAPKVEMDPSTDGVDLFLGESTDSAAVDWSAVDSLRRQFVLHARDTGMMDRHPGPAMRRQWAAELHKDKPLTADWQRVADAYAKLKASQKEALEQRLYKQPAAVSIPPQRVDPAPVDRPQVLDLSSTPGGVPILIMYAQEDAAFAQALIRSMAVYQRNGTVELIDWQAVRAGAPWRQAQTAMLDRAKIVLVLVTAASISDPDLLPSLETRTSGARVVPILCQPSMWKMTSIGRLAPLPRDEKPVGTPGNHAAWCEIVQGVIQVVNRVS